MNEFIEYFKNVVSVEDDKEISLWKKFKLDQYCKSQINDIEEIFMRGVVCGRSTNKSFITGKRLRDSDIYKLWKRGYTKYSLSEMYSLSYTRISQIIKLMERREKSIHDNIR